MLAEEVSREVSSAVEEFFTDRIVELIDAATTRPASVFSRR